MARKQWQIRTGQIWNDPDTGDNIRIDEVYASDPFDNGEWRAKIRYTVLDGREPDETTATEFARWIGKYRFTLVAQQEAHA